MLLPIGARACGQGSRTNARLLDDSKLPFPIRATLEHRVCAARRTLGEGMASRKENDATRRRETGEARLEMSARFFPGPAFEGVGAGGEQVRGALMSGKLAL